MRELPDIPERLLRDLAAAPVVDEDDIDRCAVALWGEETRAAALTGEERLILAYLSRGLTVAQTADATALTYETVKTKLKLVRYKLRAKNNTHACCEAVRRRLIK